jgi:hypothetical protein
MDVARCSTLSVSEQNTMIDACIAYDEMLEKNGHWIGGEGVQGSDTATSLRYQDGKAFITDGPFAETEEIL